MRAAGGNHRTLRKYAERIWHIPTDHFDVRVAQREQLRNREVRPLAEYLTEHSSYSRSALKRRLFSEGLKERWCELCGVGERWHGRPMSLVLDHINGVHDDNRLENLQIVCPNCAATLDTHCGRNKPRVAQAAAGSSAPSETCSGIAHSRAGRRPPSIRHCKPHSHARWSGHRTSSLSLNSSR
jgi:hypothetical protein